MHNRMCRTKIDKKELLLFFGGTAIRLPLYSSIGHPEVSVHCEQAYFSFRQADHRSQRVPDADQSDNPCEADGRQLHMIKQPPKVRVIVKNNPYDRKLTLQPVSDRID